MVTSKNKQRLAGLVGGILIVGGLGFGISQAVGGTDTGGTASADRQAEVARNGARVMPFDLTRTAHTFTDTGSGGREVVTAIDPADTQQIGLIRGHLKGLIPKFSSGDFADPAAIHGEAMPGLAELHAGYNRIEFIYEELSDGGAITYKTADPVMVSVLLTWFAAQRGDHGSTHHTTQ